MIAERIRTEYLINPIGIDILTPRVFWNCEGGITQTAFEIAFNIGGVDKTTGKVLSSDMFYKIKGKLKSRTRVNFKIRLWDENDNVGEWSENNYFEIGLQKDDWEGRWISGNYKAKKNERYPVDCFKKIFQTKDIKDARLYISACGLYEAKINSLKVGDFVLAPGVTDYRKRIQYQTYDVTKLLRDGPNDITVELADGWFRGAVGAWGRKCQYGVTTSFIAQLEITDIFGNITKIVTDKSFSWSNDGPICFADNKDGEIVDANLIPSYKSFAKEVKVLGELKASNNVQVFEHEKFSARKIITPNKNIVLDFGQNIAGYVSFRLSGIKGQKITMYFGEMLDDKGEFTQKNIQCTLKDYKTPLQKVEYTLKAGTNEYKTKFAIFGFQYVLIDADFEINANDFTAIAVYSDLENTICFNSSNDLINRFVECTRWSLKNNSCDLPTDCPTRERHGWTGDAQIFANTAGYFTSYAPFAKKYINDLKDAQKRSGTFTQIVPVGGVDFYMKFMDGSVGWSDAGILIPYRMWKLFGDSSFIEDNYTAMKKYAEFMIRRIGRKYPTAVKTGLSLNENRNIVNCGQAYGEWAEPDEVHHMTWKDCAIPHPEVATAYTSYVLGVMVKIAKHLGYTSDAERFEKYSNKTKLGYQKLRESQKFLLDTDRQADIVRPLYFDLLTDEQKLYAENRLIKALDNFNWRVGTGFLSTPLILFVLEKININYAYKLLENEDKPGWLFMPKNGATTIWEAWEGNATENGGIASLDHYSKGAVCEWIFSSMCGINVSGERNFTICPHVGGSVTHAKCAYRSAYGVVVSGWDRRDEKITYNITIPTNTTAKIIINGNEKCLLAGNYIFTEEVKNEK